MLRFVHTADVHLDSPLRSLALRDPSIAQWVATATRVSFQRTVDLCLAEEVDALVVAGDLYDGDLRSMKTAAFLSNQLRRLCSQGIRVFIVRGNHDAESVITRQLTLPEGVHVFSGRGERLLWEERGVAVHGVSFAKPQAPHSLLPKFKAPAPGLRNLGLMHTSLAGAPGHDVYAPCTLHDLRSQGYDYWALGHVHQRQVHAHEPAFTVVMPGIPQGRHVREAGAKSVTLATLYDDGTTALVEHSTQVAEFSRLRLQVGSTMSWTELVAQTEQRLREARQQAKADFLILRVELEGVASLRRRLLRDHDVLFAELREVAATVGRIGIEALDLGDLSDSSPTMSESDSTRAAADAPDDIGPLAALKTLSEEALDDSAFIVEAQQGVEELAAQLPPELREAFSALALDEQRLKDLIRRGSETLRARRL